MDIGRVLNERIPCDTSERADRRLPEWRNEPELADREGTRKEGWRSRLAEHWPLSPILCRAAHGDESVRER